MVSELGNFFRILAISGNRDTLNGRQPKMRLLQRYRILNSYGRHCIKKLSTSFTKLIPLSHLHLLACDKKVSLSDLQMQMNLVSQNKILSMALLDGART